uniref:Uncharacterized protein n=1 Tax=Panagrolaimus sp. ES5 TaxID=591445 RepID=A0AC34F1Z4_9BILA
MATKEHSLLNKQDTVKDQYSNLNLNHHNQSFNKKNAPLQNLDNADENSEIDSGDADPDGTLVADGAQNELSLEHPRMDSILDDWGFSRIEHSQSMNEFSSYFDQPIRSTPAAKRYVHGKRLLRPLLDTNISADDITPSEYSTGVTSAFNGYSVNLDENMFGNAISSSMASNSEDGPSENDVEGTSGENV